MGYLGNSNSVQNFTPAVDYFNGNGSTRAFTLSRTVGSVFDIQAFIENVPQNPSTAFTVAGNIITFDSAPPSGTNNIYVRYTSPVVQQVKPAPGTVGTTEISSSVTLTTPLISGNLNFDSTGTSGIRLPSANTLAFTTSGTEDMRIDSSGNVGIGTTSPTTKLQISGSDAVLLNGEGNGDRSYGSTFASISKPNIALAYSTDNSTYKNFSGLGIDFTNGVFGIVSNNQYTGGGKIAFYTGDITSTTGSFGERMRITSDGTLQVKSSTATAPWDATSGNYVWIGGTYPVGGANSGIIAIFNRHTNNGTVVEIKKGTSLLGTISHNGTNTAYNTSSDYRLKENIAPMTGALKTISLLKPCTYTWKSDGSKGQGFIAHELQECLPDAVTGEKDAVETYKDENGNEQTRIKPQQIDTSFLVATLTAAIQEQQAIIENLKARIEVLEAK